MTPKNEKTDIQNDVVVSTKQTTKLETERIAAEKPVLKQTTRTDEFSLQQPMPDGEALQNQTTPDEALLKQTISEGDVLLNQMIPDESLVKPSTSADDALLKQTTLEEDASLRRKTYDVMVDDAINRISTIQISDSSTDGSDVRQRNDENDADREQDSLTETLLESDGNSVGCESDLDSDGLSEEDHFRQRKFRSVEKGEGRPNRMKVASQRHQPYRTPSRSSQEDSQGSVALPSPEIDEFLHNLVSGNATGMADNSQSGTCFQHDNSSDSDDVLQGVANALVSSSGGDGFDDGSLICDSYQRSIPIVVEEKMKEPDEPEKKSRRKRAQKKKNLRNESQATVPTPNHYDDITMALQVIHGDLAEVRVTRQENGVNLSNSSDIQNPSYNCYANQLDAHFAISTSSMDQQNSTYPSVFSGSNVTTQQTTCHTPQASHFINPITSSPDSGMRLISTHPGQPSTSFSPTSALQAAGPLAVSVPPNFRPFRLTTAGTTGVPSQQFLACTLLPLQAAPQPVMVNLPQPPNSCQILPPSTELVYSSNISLPVHSVNSGLPTLLPKPT